MDLKMSKNNRWSKQEINIATSMLEEYSTFQEISKCLNRTEKAVREKMKKLGYKRTKFSTEIVKCKFCQKEFSDYRENARKFCSRSCAASFNNSIYIKRQKIINGEKTPRKDNFCLSCSIQIKSHKKYCSISCQQDLNLRNRIKSGKFSAKVAKRWLLKTQGNKCSMCSLESWNDKPIPIELDHIDGNHENNSLENVRLLCPNCHAQTPTYKAKNMGYGRHKRRIRYANGKSY